MIKGHFNLYNKKDFSQRQSEAGFCGEKFICRILQKELVALANWLGDIYSPQFLPKQKVKKYDYVYWGKEK